MVVKFNMTKDVFSDFIKYSVEHMEYTKKMYKRSLFMTIVLFSLPLFVVMLLSFKDEYYYSSSLFGILFLICIFALPNIKGIKKGYIRSTIKTTYRQQVKRGLINPKDDIHVTLTEEGAFSTDGKSSTSINWEHVHKLCKSDNMILIYINQSMAIIIPKSSFESDEAFKKCYETCEQFKYEAYMKNKEQNQN